MKKIANLCLLLLLVHGVTGQTRRVTKTGDVISTDSVNAPLVGKRPYLTKLGAGGVIRFITAEGVRQSAAEALKLTTITGGNGSGPIPNLDQIPGTLPATRITNLSAIDLSLFGNTNLYQTRGEVLGAVAEQTQSLTQVSRVYTDSVVTARMAAMSTGVAPATARPDFLLVGDSLSEPTNGLTYQTTLQSRYPKANIARVTRGGAQAAQMAAALGAVDIESAVPNNVIPASGSVEIRPTGIDVLPSGLTVRGKLNGVPGTLTRSGNGTAAVYTFTRLAPGEAVSLTTGRALFLAEFLYPGRTTIVQLGQNDAATTRLFRYNIEGGTANGAQTGIPVLIKSLVAIKNLVERNGGICLFVEVNGANTRPAFPIRTSVSDAYDDYGISSLRFHPQGANRRMVETFGPDRVILAYSAMTAQPNGTARDKKDSLYNIPPQSYRWSTSVNDTNDVHLSEKGVLFLGNKIADHIDAYGLYTPVSTTVSSSTTATPAPVFSSTFVNANTVAHFDFSRYPPTIAENGASLAQGGSTLDNKGSGPDATIINGGGGFAWNATEKAFYVNGNTEALNLGGSSVYDTGPELFWFSMYVKQSALVNGYPQLFGKSLNTSTSNISYRIDVTPTGDFRAFVASGNSLGLRQFNNTPTQADYVHLAFERTPVGFRLYVNKELTVDQGGVTGPLNQIVSELLWGVGFKGFLRRLTFERNPAGVDIFPRIEADYNEAVGQ